MTHWLLFLSGFIAGGFFIITCSLIGVNRTSRAEVSQREIENKMADRYYSGMCLTKAIAAHYALLRQTLEDSTEVKHLIGE